MSSSIVPDNDDSKVIDLASAASEVAARLREEFEDGGAVTRAWLEQAFSQDVLTDAQFRNAMSHLHSEMRLVHKRILEPTNVGIWRVVPPNEHAQLAYDTEMQMYKAASRAGQQLMECIDKPKLTDAERREAVDLEALAAEKRQRIVSIVQEPKLLKK